MSLIREYTDEKKLLSTYLPWYLFVDDGIVLNTNGTLMKTIEFRGCLLYTSPSPRDTR